MPRVSDDHLEARRRQILDAARRCFARNGFHATSMQDVLRESGLSAGAVYRYFPSKEAMIITIAEEGIAEIRTVITEDPDKGLSVPQLLERALLALAERDDGDEIARIALQVWAEAARSDAVRERLAGAIRETRAVVAALIRREDGPDVDAEARAAAFVALMPGYIQTRVILGDMDPARFLEGLGGLAADAAALRPDGSR